MNAVDILAQLFAGGPGDANTYSVHIGGVNTPVLTVEVRVAVRSALDGWAAHWGITDGFDRPMGNGKMDCVRYGQKRIDGRPVKVTVSGNLQAAS